MANLEARYLPSDRLQALTAGVPLPTTANGCVLFADISGFTAVTERLRIISGARRGAEALVVRLNQVYDALIAEVERYDGSIIGFAGDAITCWFSGEASAARATTCGLALLDAMRAVEQITLSEGETMHINLKVVITSGTTKRFVVGDPDIQLMDTLAGATVARLATGGNLAKRGELLIDEQTFDLVGNSVVVRAWRQSEGHRFAILERMTKSSDIVATRDISLAPLPTEVLLPWMLPAFARHIKVGLGEFEIELRPAVALFLRFSGVDYDHDAEAGDKLNRLVRLVQAIVRRYDGNVLQVTIGDKGSYLYAAFGAPYAHEDDAIRTLNVALDLREATSTIGYLDPVQIGISRGMMRTGAYGAGTRRTYGVLGDEVNLAAHLMNLAAPGEILVSESMSSADLSNFTLERLPPVQVKGKANAVSVFRLVDRRDRSFEERFFSTPLVGRDAELAELQQALQPIFEGQHGGVIWIYGEPGMGKSRLAFEAQKRLHAGPAVTWLTGQVDALNRSQLGAFAYFLRQYFEQRRDRDHATNLVAFDRIFDGLFVLGDEATRNALGYFRSFLAGIVGLIIPDAPYERLDEKSRIDIEIAAIKAWARAESSRQPLVIHLEDVQWLDPSSLRTVQHLTYNMQNIPLALVLTSRYDDDGTPFTVPDIHSVPVHTLDLNRLSNVGVDTVASVLLGEKISERLAAFVRERAEGNPFFTEQLVFDLQDRGVLVQTDGQWDMHLDAIAEVPSRVNEVLIARLDRLATQVKSVVQTAAVLGREFEIEVLSRMLRQEDVFAVREAEREAIWTALDALRYLFRHALLRDAAYEMQAQERLKSLHRLAAEAIEALYPNDAAQHEALLEHWHSAGDLERELHYLDQVANQLLRVVAQYDRAGQLLERALGQLGEADSRRASLLNWLSLVHIMRDNYAEARAAALQALSLMSPDDRKVLAVSLRRLGSVDAREGLYSEARAHLEQSLTIYREIGDPLGESNILQQLGNTLREQGSYAEARAYLEPSLEIRREIGDRLGISSSLASLGSVARFQGKYEEARAHTEQSLTICQEIGDRSGTARAFAELGTIARLHGRYEDARASHEQGLAIRRDIGDRSGAANSLISLGNIAFAQGAFAEARSYFESSLGTLREIGEPLGISGTLNNLGVVAVLQGEYDAAKAYQEEALAIRRTIGDRRGIADSLNNLGTLAYRQKDFPAAEPYHRESLALHRELNDGFVYSSLGWLGRTVLQLGRAEEARDLLREAFNVLRAEDVAHKLTLSVLAAEYCSKMDRLEAAAELAGLILPHPLTEAESRNDTEALLAELRERLDSTVMEDALERGKSLDLDSAVARLLAEPS